MYHESYATHAAARVSLFDDIEVFYNRERRHSALGDVSPVPFEEAAQPALTATRPSVDRAAVGSLFRRERLF